MWSRAASDRPFIERARDWDTTSLPVPADLLVYTSGEWQKLLLSDTRFAREAEQHAVWIFP